MASYFKVASTTQQNAIKVASSTPCTNKLESRDATRMITWSYHLTIDKMMISYWSADGQTS